MIVKNFSKDFDYHTQRNNAVIPYKSCNTTSMIMAMKQAGVPIPDVGDQQPEDALSTFMNTPEAREWLRRRARWAVGIYLPQEVHTCLEWGVNEWTGQTIDRFREDYTWDELFRALNDGCGVVLSGRFPMSGGDLGHIVSVAGYVVHDDMLAQHTTEVIIDDPYGNWHTRYRDHHGNNTRLVWEDFAGIFKKQHGFWAHVIRSV